MTSSLAMSATLVRDVATYAGQKSFVSDLETVQQTAVNSVFDCTSTARKPTTVFFNGDGLMSAWTNELYQHGPSISICMIGGAFQVAERKMEEMRSNGLSSSSMEITGAEISAELASVYALDKSGTERLAARHMMSYLESKLSSKSLGAANRMLASADVSKLSSRSMIGMIRSTYRIKKDLPSWGTVYAKSWKRVKEIGKNPEALFIGLPRAEEVEGASTPE